MFAITFIIIITSIAALFLAYFNMNYRVLNQLELRSLGKQYCIQGLSVLAKEDILYSHPYEISMENGLVLKIEKRKWGVYDIYYSTAIHGKNDTAYSKVAIAGTQKSASCNLSLYLPNRRSPLTIGDSVSIQADCKIPNGRAQYYTAADVNKNPFKEQIFSSADSMVRPCNFDSTIAWLSTYKSGTESRLDINDTIAVSFFSPTRVLSADTVDIAGALNGNIVIAANAIIVRSGAIINDAILIAGDIIVQANFSGSAQLFASNSLTLGSHVTFHYPTVLALFPEINAGGDMALRSHYFSCGDSVKISGEIYAYARRADVASNSLVNLRNTTRVAGIIYTAGGLQWQGWCKGCVMADKLLNRNGAVMQANFLSHATIDSISPFFAYCTLFPYPGKKKIVAWVN